MIIQPSLFLRGGVIGDPLNQPLAYADHALPLALVMVVHPELLACLPDQRSHLAQVVMVDGREQVVGNVLVEAGEECHRQKARKVGGRVTCSS